MQTPIFQKMDTFARIPSPNLIHKILVGINVPLLFDYFSLKKHKNFLLSDEE